MAFYCLLPGASPEGRPRKGFQAWGAHAWEDVAEDGRAGGGRPLQRVFFSPEHPLSLTSPLPSPQDSVVGGGSGKGSNLKAS